MKPEVILFLGNVRKVFVIIFAEALWLIFCIIYHYHFLFNLNV